MSGGDGSDESREQPAGPDLGAAGVALAEIPDGGMLAGRFGDQAVLLVRRGDAVHALGASCTHYGGPLAEGFFDGECVRCPLHQAGFRPETGEAVHAPAIDPVPTFAVERREGRVFVTGAAEAKSRRRPIASPPSSVVIVGGGAAGFAAAERLRREGYEAPVTIVSADSSAPVDRPNLSKDYLAGGAPEEWLPLRADDWYAQSRIGLELGRRVTGIDRVARRVELDDGRRLDYGALLLAPGAAPVRLPIPGAERPHVHTLRTLTDSRAIVASAVGAERAVVVGASFIGLEVAASLIERGLDVAVVAPEAVPMARVLGDELGAFVRGLHEGRGVRFHLGRTVAEIGEGTATLDDGTRLAADLVVLGVGVRPELALAESAGLALDHGVVVDRYLRTSTEGIWAAGDVARWPDPWSGEAIRVEHWVVAERQGQTAARNILGCEEPFAAAPFFWSQHYDVAIHYVGHAESWDAAETFGDVAKRNCLVAYRKDGKPLAVASIGRDRDSLRIAAAMERGDAGAVEAILTETDS